jgi:tetratricopeptide (TPR) repeat protein
LLREAAYQMQVHARRRELHALAFETYQKLYADSLSGHYSELAYHAEQAGMQAEARSYLALAGKDAFERFQNQRADDYYTRALSLTPESDPSGRYELFQARENINKRLSNYPDRLRDLQEIEGILPVLNDPVKEADFLLRMAEYHKGQAESPKATEYAARAVDLALKIGQTKQAAAGFLLLGTFARYQGQYETAYQHDLRGLELARQAQATQEELNALNNLALLDMDRMHFETARDRLFEGLEVARREGFLQTEAVLLHNLGRVSGMQGDHEASQKYIMESLAIDQKIGYRTGEALANINLGYVLTMQGNYSKALLYLEHANRFLREVGDLFYQVYALVNLSACLNILGEPAAAEERSRMGLALARKTGSRDGEAWTLTYLGHSLLAQAAHDPAVEAYSAALAIRMELDQPALAAEPSAGLARAALKQGDAAGALKAIEPVLAHLEGGGSLDGCDDPLRVYLTGYQVLRAAGDPRAVGLLETAYRQLQERAAKIRDAELRDSILNNVAHHREICEAWETLDQAG